MKRLKNIGIFVVCIILAFGAGFMSNECLWPRVKDFIAQRKLQETVVAAETDISVSSFLEIPAELPEGWTKVEVTTKLPAVALGSDFPKYNSPGGHNENDGYDLAIFYDENHTYYVTVPTINATIAEMCAEHGYGIIAVSIYDRSAYRLETEAIFYDSIKEMTITLESSNWSIDSDEPYFHYSGAAFGSISNLVAVGSSDDEPTRWTELNTPYLGESVGYHNVGWSTSGNQYFYEFNPYRIMIHEEYVDEGRKTPVELISEILNGYEAYEEILDEQISVYTSLLDYFTDAPASDDPEMPEDFIPEFEEFDLENCAKEYFGAEVTSSYDASYLDVDKLGETEELLGECTEIVNIKLNDLDIGIVYTYCFDSMDDELWSITVNGKKLDYETVYDSRTCFRSEDLSSEVKIGEKAKIDRGYFDYIIALMFAASNK